MFFPESMLKTHPLILAWEAQNFQHGAASLEEFGKLVDQQAREIVGSGEYLIDKRAWDGKGSFVTPRTIRYYVSNKWIQKPHRIRNKRGLFYEKRHFLQALLTAKRRAMGSDVYRLSEIRDMEPAQCLEALLATGEDVLAAPTRLQKPKPLEHLRIVLTGEGMHSGRDDEETLRRACRLIGKDWCRYDSLPKSAAQHLPKATGKEAPSQENLVGIRKDMPGITEKEMLHLVTATKHRHDWFDDWDEQTPRNGVLHVDDDSLKPGAGIEIDPAHLIALHSMLLSLLAALAETGLSPLTLCHARSRGCLQDFCGDKADVFLKLRTADFCHECWPSIKERVPAPILEQLAGGFERLRKEARIWKHGH